MADAYCGIQIYLSSCVSQMDQFYFTYISLLKKSNVRQAHNNWTEGSSDLMHGWTHTHVFYRDHYWHPHDDGGITFVLFTRRCIYKRFELIFLDQGWWKFQNLKPRPSYKYFAHQHSDLFRYAVLSLALTDPAHVQNLKFLFLLCCILS